MARRDDRVGYAAAFARRGTRFDPVFPGNQTTEQNERAGRKDGEQQTGVVFGQLTWTPPILEDRLHLTVGGRQTKDEKNG